MTHHCRNRELTIRMTARYDLEAEHVAFVTGSGKTTNKVQGIVEEAEERKEQAAVDHSGGAFAAVEAAVTDAAGASDADADASESDAEDGDGTLSAFGAASEAGGDGTAASGDGDAADDDRSPEERAEAADEDDGQAGLGDFM
jgi:replication factor C large subunit